MSDEKKKLVLWMPLEFGDGVSKVLWDPEEDPCFYLGSDALDGLGLEDGDVLEIKVVAMTQAEMDVLPEI